VSIPAPFARRGHERRQAEPNAPFAKPVAYNWSATMRFIIFVKATPETEAATRPDEGIDPAEKDRLMAAMADYHEELAKAGALLDASGLHPSAKGWRIRYSGGKRTVIDGPFAEAKELVAGYTLIQVKSREEALEWARRFPAPMGEKAEAEIEVRQLYELEDFTPNEPVDRFREIGIK
jgi:hypothetical protein